MRVSAMEDSSNGKVEETREVQSVDECKDVVVEDVEDSSKLIGVESLKVLEINGENHSEPASKRSISIIEQIIESAEKLVDSNDSSSSSSSSGEEENKVPDHEEVPDQVEEKEAVVCLSQQALVENEKEEIDGSSPAETEENTLTSSSVENDVVADFMSKGIEETKLQSSYENNDFYDEDITCVDQKDEANSASEEVSEGIDGPKLPILEENNTGQSSQAASEAASGNACNPEIAENRENPSAVPVTRSSLQATSWTSCCGLFEVLRRSDR